MSQIFGQQIVDLALTHVGEKYVLGAIAPKNRADYNGPWDCAEFASYLIYQLTGKLYGCAKNNGQPDTADAYTGFWARDAQELGKIITLEEAAMTPGAFVLRLAGKGLIGHIVVSDGKGGTVEAHSTKTGVLQNKIAGRRWDYGIEIPWITYEKQTAKFVPVGKPVNKIYRFTEPMMYDEFVKVIQRTLKIKDDGWYGQGTYNAVRAFQTLKGIVADGEAGPKTLSLLGIS